MQRYDDDVLAERLAAEFVLGSLRGAARRRFIALMQERAAWRAIVLRLEEQFYPLALRGPAVKAPRRVWRRIHARIAPRAVATGGWRGWRGAVAGARWRLGALAGAAALVLLGALVLGIVSREPPATMIALLSQQQGAEPGILVSWTPEQAARRQIAVRILAHPQMPPDTAWQAWLVRGDAPPLSLGLVSAEAEQVLDISPPAARALGESRRIGVSVEPKGGSARPSGVFLFEGAVVRLTR